MNNDNYNNYNNQNQQNGNYNNYQTQKPDNQNQTLLIIILAVLVVLLVVMVSVVCIYAIRKPVVKTEQKVVEVPVEVPVQTQPQQTQKTEPVPPQPPVVQPDNTYNQRMAIKNNYLSRAEGIEQYSRNYLDTATSQSSINIESGNVFTKWDVLLNDVYKYLKTIMTKSDFKKLEQEELNWIRQKEAAIEAAAKDWQGGSGEPMARNMTGIDYTKDRCYYLISLIN